MINVCLNTLVALLDFGGDGPEWDGQANHRITSPGNITSAAWEGWWWPDEEPTRVSRRLPRPTFGGL